MTDRFRPIASETLSDGWGRLTRHRFALRRLDGAWDEQAREVYDRGDAVACLLHDPAAGTVLLVRQFRLPEHLAGREAFMIEAPAGFLDGADPEDRVRAELMEETGFEARDLAHVVDLVPSPGSVKERIACFLGRYDRAAPAGAGGGRADEGEDIEILHLPFTEALAGIGSGRITDAKTVVLIQALALAER